MDRRMVEEPDGYHEQEQDHQGDEHGDAFGDAAAVVVVDCWVDGSRLGFLRWRCFSDDWGLIRWGNG